MNENDEIYGTSRMLAAIHNQSDAGESEFHLPFEEAMDLLDELREESRDLKNELTELWVNLGVYEENPPHYKGDGTVSCARAMRSMLHGWEKFAEPIANEPAYWATSAFKYLWRFPLKGHPREDLAKALDCCQKALDAWGDGE